MFASLIVAVAIGGLLCSFIVLELGGGVEAFDMSAVVDDFFAHDIMPKASAASTSGGIANRIQRSRSIISFLLRDDVGACPWEPGSCAAMTRRVSR
jgi:hypothetical protein